MSANYHRLLSCTQTLARSHTPTHTQTHLSLPATHTRFDNVSHPKLKDANCLGEEMHFMEEALESLQSLAQNWTASLHCVWVENEVHYISLTPLSTSERTVAGEWPQLLSNMLVVSIISVILIISPK